MRWAKKTKSAAFVLISFPPNKRMQNLKRLSTSGNTSLTVLEVVERHERLRLHQTAEEFFGGGVGGDSRRDKQPHAAARE